MPRVLGFDPGTITLDLCGLDAGRLVLDQSLRTSEALRDADALLRLIRDAGPFDLIAGPSGYGLPLVAAQDISEENLALACLAPSGERGGIGGLRRLMRRLAELPIAVVFTPGVIHLPTVPDHRKVNRVDLGTADKVCAVVLALHERVQARGCAPQDVSFILLELGGAFSAAIAVQDGAIVDGLGGTSGPIGLRAAGALDGEVAYLSRSITKAQLFQGGAADVAGIPDLPAEALATTRSPRGTVGREVYLEGAVKAVAMLRVSAPSAREIVLSGRAAGVSALRDELTRRLGLAMPDVHVTRSTGVAAVAREGAQGAALVADGLAGGGASAAIVASLGIRDARGTVLDHLVVVSREAARARLGLSDGG